MTTTFDYQAATWPSEPAAPDVPPHQLTAGQALAELETAVGGWITDAVESRTGRPHDPDRTHAGHIMAALYDAAGYLRDAEYAARDRVVENRFQRASAHVHGAAASVDMGVRVARGQRAGTDPYADAEAVDYIRAHYVSAVVYARMARAILREAGEFVSAVATTTRCAGGSVYRACSHGRFEDHPIADDTRCEAAIQVRDTDLCTGPGDVVVVRTGDQGQRTDPTDTRGLRGCVGHAARLLAHTAGGTVYPGPGDTSAADGRNYVVETYTSAQRLKETAGAGR